MSDAEGKSSPDGVSGSGGRNCRITDRIYSEEKLRELVEIRKMNPLQILCGLVMGSLIKRKVITQGMVNLICRDVGPRFVEVLQAMGYVKETYPSGKEGLIELIGDVCKVMGMSDIVSIQDSGNGVTVKVDTKFCRLCIKSVDEDVPRAACIFPKIFEAMANHVGIKCSFDPDENFVKKEDGECRITFVCD